MYKVFYNQKSLHFTTVLSNNSKNTPLFFIKYANANSIIKALKDRAVTEVYLYHSNAKKIEKHFFKTFQSVEAAGGLVKHQDGRFLFIYRNNKWDLPKGKIEKRETLIKAAIREVSEETGVCDLIIKKPLPKTYHIYNANGKFKVKKTNWFLMESNYLGPLAPQIEENIQMAVWKKDTEIPELMKNAYENIKIILKALD
ncbi:MAG: NUDIX domain-containing protein [Flavobacteriaceae bacterium]|nr:NUDIX domain-containing protein [Flavobacteriaceae bacterium]